MHVKLVVVGAETKTDGVNAGFEFGSGHLILMPLGLNA
jgi:hypothetical protein